jgi:hypothetical protein
LQKGSKVGAHFFGHRRKNVVKFGRILNFHTVYLPAKKQKFHFGQNRQKRPKKLISKNRSQCAQNGHNCHLLGTI